MPARNKEKKPAARRRDQERAEGLTFLEKLVLRVLPTRQVPPESGVRFSIASKAREDGICLVFKVDDPETPIVEQGPRPDYLVIHLSRKDCLFTIVEMKGREEKNVEHGIEQICAMHDRLRRELTSCLPGSVRRIKIQGILLTPQNSQVNVKKIRDAVKRGIEILPLQYHHQTELYPYISRAVSRTERYTHEEHRRVTPELNPVERLIAEGKQERRTRGAHFQSRRGAARDTLYLDFRVPGAGPRATVSLSATTDDAILGFSADASPYQGEAVAHLTSRGLECPKLRILSNVS